MENTVLKKKLSTFRSSKGYFKKVSNDLLLEVLRGWEQWEGSSREFYSSIGVSQTQMAAMIGRAKKLKREGHVVEESEFEELMSAPVSTAAGSGGCMIELSWSDGKLIRFSVVDQLLEFLKKAA